MKPPEDFAVDAAPVKEKPPPVSDDCAGAGVVVPKENPPVLAGAGAAVPNENPAPLVGAAEVVEPPKVKPPAPMDPETLAPPVEVLAEAPLSAAAEPSRDISQL